MKILITGGTGLIGTSIEEIKGEYPQYDFVFSSSKDYDLTIEEHVKDLFEKTKPDYVLHAAAKTGGMGAKLAAPAEQFYDNVLMNSYVIHYSYLHNVKRLLVFSAKAAFSPDLHFIKEDDLHVGSPHPIFYSYGYSKRMMDIQIQSYKKQYGTNFCSVICGNVFGKRDGFNVENGNVIPSLIHKCFLAKNNNTSLNVWGDGTPYREFIYSKDVARICIELLNDAIELPSKVIVAGDKEVQIKELVNIICEMFDYYNIEWLSDKPNGSQKRTSDKSVFRSLLPSYKFTNLNDALKQTVEWFLEKYPDVRQ
jgi:GDP-L-fucose synthase